MEALLVVPSSAAKTLTDTVTSLREEPLIGTEVAGLLSKEYGGEVGVVKTALNALLGASRFTVPLERSRDVRESRDHLWDMWRQLDRVDRASVLVPEAFVLTPKASLDPVGASELKPQYYLDDERSGGIAARGFNAPSGRGEASQLAVLEAAWAKHEDLPISTIEVVEVRPPAQRILYKPERDHGNAVLGALAAKRDGVGIDGIVDLIPTIRFVHYGSRISGTGTYFNVFEPLAEAILSFEGGSGVLVVPFNGIKATPDTMTDQLGLEAWWAARALFILAAARGIIPVIAAGNGGQDLALKSQGHFFPSPAIVVAGGAPMAADAAGFTNTGSRIDVHSWGTQVPALVSSVYTNSFNGSSSATAIVAGAVAAIHSHLVSRDMTPSPGEIRDLLVWTGYWHNPTIGPRPHLKRMWAGLQEVDYDFDRIRAEVNEGRVFNS